VNKDKPFNPKGPNGPTYSAYITYSSDQEASLAILVLLADQAVDDFDFEYSQIKASYGTTKYASLTRYCTFYLKDKQCPNSDCLYLHFDVPNDRIISKDYVNNRELFQEQQKVVREHLEKYANDIFNLNLTNNPDSVFPNISEAFERLRKVCEEKKIPLIKNRIKPKESSIPKHL